MHQLPTLLAILIGLAFPHSSVERSAVDTIRAPYVMILGTAQDAGIPQAGCYSKFCNYARQTGGRKLASSLAIIDPETHQYFLVDVSPDVREQLDLIPEAHFKDRASARNPLDGILLTHGHIGHYSGLVHLGKEGMGIGPTAAYIDSTMASFLASNGPWSLMVDEGRLDLIVVEPGAAIKLTDRLSATPLLIPHRAEFTRTLAWLVQGPKRNLLYLPDIDRWSEMERPILRLLAEWSVDVALIDGTFYSGDELPGRDMTKIPHPPIAESVKLLEDKPNLKTEIVFTHFNNTNPAAWDFTPEAAIVRESGFGLARRGMIFEL